MSRARDFLAPKVSYICRLPLNGELRIPGRRPQLKVWAPNSNSEVQVWRLKFQVLPHRSIVSADSERGHRTDGTFEKACSHWTHACRICALWQSNFIIAEPAMLPLKRPQTPLLVRCCMATSSLSHKPAGQCSNDMLVGLFMSRGHRHDQVSLFLFLPAANILRAASLT